MATSNNLFISVSPIVQKLIITSGMKMAAQSSIESIASQLCAAAESFYLKRNYVSLSQVADVLCTLPGEHVRAAGMLYKARCLYNANRNDQQVISLLEAAGAIGAAPATRARAIQALGVVYSHRGNLQKASSLLCEAIRANDAVASVRAAFTFSEIASAQGDHDQALDYLRKVRPAVQLLSQRGSLLLPQYANEVAFELLQNGKPEEARRFAAFAVASPYSRAYPEWTETAQEIEQAREAIAAHKSILRVAVRANVPKLRKRTPRTLFLILKLTLKAPRRLSQPRTAIFTRELPRSRPTLEQVSLKIRIRAPSF